MRSRKLAPPGRSRNGDHMPHYDFRTPRVYLDAPLAAGQVVSLDRAQANYLLNVLRLKQGDELLLFNGRDGEWQARLAGTGKRAPTVMVGEQRREQPRPGDLHFLFAPLKHARLDYLVQKAIEMGVTIKPVSPDPNGPIEQFTRGHRFGRTPEENLAFYFKDHPLLK